METDCRATAGRNLAIKGSKQSRSRPGYTINNKGAGMMQNESTEILEDLLSQWHRWARGYKSFPGGGSDPMFRGAKSSRAWDSSDDILDAEINSKIMHALDFQVGEMQEPWRSAIYCLARNCATGVSVWRSPRLPEDPFERTTIVVEAKNQLIKKLLAAGII